MAAQGTDKFTLNVYRLADIYFVYNYLFPTDQCILFG